MTTRPAPTADDVLELLVDVLAERVAARLAPAPARATEAAGLLTLTEAGARLGVSRSTVARWIDDGRLPALAMTDTRRRVPAGAVARLLADAEEAGDGA